MKGNTCFSTMKHDGSGCLSDGRMNKQMSFDVEKHEGVATRYGCVEFISVEHLRHC